MADIKEKIKTRFGIDIAAENIFKLYKIDSADISPAELETKIADTRKRWNISINGANEKFAARDKARLEKADSYEAILRDPKARQEVFAFCTNPTGSGTGAAAASDDGHVGFAREYFKLVATTKRIKKSDVDFFFKYYQSERKHKKAILEMLSGEMKVSGLGKEGSYKDEDGTEEEGKKKKGPIIVNLFQEATVLKIQRALEKYTEAAASNELCARYPKLRESFYNFLEIDKISDAAGFLELVSQKGREAFSVRQEKGAAYVPVVDLFNILQSIAGNSDVVDNFGEFKLLLKYPNLTPYMFAFVDMKPNTLKGMTDIANKDYSFRNEADFIVTYYKPVHDNFGITDSSIRPIIRKAERKAAQNRILNGIDKKLGRDGTRKLPFVAELIHFFAYWPVFLAYFLFEIARVVFTKIRLLSIPVSALVFLYLNWIVPKTSNTENLLVLHKIFLGTPWLEYLRDTFGSSSINNWLDIILLSLVSIVMLLMVYVLPALFTYFFISNFSDDFNKRFDWIGIKRTFKQILLTLRKGSFDQYKNDRKLFVKRKVSKIVINAVFAALIAGLVIALS